MTPYYEDEQVRLYAGDCLDVLRELADNSIDAVVCDPPYSLSFMGREWDSLDGKEDAGFAYWLAGFIDGEGCFRVQRHERGTYTCTFSLKVRRDERGTLEAIKRFVGVGTIRDDDAVYGNSKPCTRYAVQDKAGCLRLVQILDKYPLRAKKRLDYEAWAEAVIEWNTMKRGNRWNGGSDWSRMAALKARIESARQYVEPPWSGNEFQDWCRLWATECLRVLKPGGHMLAFGGTRTWHRLACAVEDAGFEIRDSIAWLYGSGFSKSLNVSKAIDKAAGVEREVIGVHHGHGGGSEVSGSMSGPLGTASELPLTAPVTDAAKKWDGWGTGLKPAHESIVVARKPLQAGTVAANVQAWGTGALNIDGCRVPHGDDVDLSQVQRQQQGDDNGWRLAKTNVGADIPMYKPGGRWPANVVLDGAAAAELDRQSGTLKSGDGCTRRQDHRTSSMAGVLGKLDHEEVSYGDSGGASRFFAVFESEERLCICGHAYRHHLIRIGGECIYRGHGCDCAKFQDFPTFKYSAKAATAERPTADGVAHPTVKPLELMRWLVRLVTPPGGTVLDPFAGSGTTGEAAIHEHKKAVLIEREPSYLPLIVARLSKPMQVGFDLEGTG